MPDVSIIIVNWNSKAYLQPCLDSLFRHCRNTELEVIVVDNASYDGCDRMLAERFPSVMYVQSEKNLGFARANNLGVLRSAGRFLLFLNPDTELLEDSIQILINRLASLPAAGAVGCKLLNTDRSFQTSCVQSLPTVFNQVIGCDALRARFPRWKIWGLNSASQNDAAEVEFISGACIMMKREVFKAIGGFTESYFMYGEDADLCLKTRRAGYAVLYVPDTSLVHHGGGSSQSGASNFSSVMMKESVYLYFLQRSGWPTAVFYRFAMACSAIVRMVLLSLTLVVSGKSRGRARNSRRKWVAVLRWSAGLERWVKNYFPS